MICGATVVEVTVNAELVALTCEGGVGQSSAVGWIV